ncbi:anthranilate synthase, component I [Halogranum amylolyticum]|uniref:Anthranilate synthase component 1 n=1 Tax=Halogranum amylolyticum TaxID=660520 RepID=A0A1H8NFF7_9EURY|nr:anthranilate synthase component I [Halogranum amylolyticum]SEO28219.1 anthranilate synthase, component I [Halogranum amylolyticum]
MTFDRSKEAFCDLVDSADGPAVARVAATLDVDVAPLTAYAALADESEHSFLLESAEKVASSDPAGAFTPDASSADRHARFSFVGYDPEAVVTVTPDDTEVDAVDDRVTDLLSPGDGDVLDRLRGTLPDVERVGFPDSDRQHLDGGLVGFLAYDAVYDLWLDEVGVERSTPVDQSLPDAQFVLTTRTLVFDESDGSLSLVCTPIVHPDDDPAAVYDELAAEAARVASVLADADEPETGGFRRTDETAGPQAEYEEAVRQAKQHVLDGDIYQGVISRKRELTGDVDTLGFYEALRAVNPSPYMYLLQHGDRSIVGASPETLVSVQGRRVVSNPIAGTCARGDSPVEDRRLAGEMLADDKERSEHTMLVDLARNDVRRVSEAGSVRIEEFMNVLKYSHVQHIESTVTGRLAADCDVAEGTSADRQTRSVDAFDATRAAFPAGTLSGAPKVRAMEIIDDLERGPRGLYGGGVGYYSWTGDADFAIVIRTATIDHGVETDRGVEDRITVQAGAGIVADSDPTKEYEETEKKMRGVLAAVDRIEDEP